MSKNIPNRKMNEKRHNQGFPALFTMIAFLAEGVRVTRTVIPAKGRFEYLPIARAEAQVRSGRWNT